MRKLLLLFGVSVLIAIFIFFVYQNVSLKKTENQIMPASLPTNGSVPNNYGSDPKIINDARKSFLAGQLINKLPYTGSNFYLSFDYSTGYFTLVLNKNNLELGNKEFDDFLLQNSVSDRSWISNLKVTTGVLRP